MDYQDMQDMPLGGLDPNQGVPLAQKMDASDFIEKIKPDLIVEILRHKLMGEEFNGTNWVQLPYLKDKALSQRGAWELSNLMLGASSINTSISKLSKEQIKNRLMGLLNEAMVMILANWKDYGIKNIGQIYYTKSIIFSNALSVLSQADDGSIQDLFKRTISETRSVASMEGNSRKEPGKIKRMLGVSRG